jgi:hypothetical protein
MGATINRVMIVSATLTIRRKSMGLFKKLGESMSFSQENYNIEDVLVGYNTFDKAQGNSKNPMWRFEYDGTGSPDKLNKELAQILGPMSLYQEDPGDKTYYTEYVDESTYVRMYYCLSKDDTQIQVRGATDNEDTFKRIKKLSLASLKTKNDSNSVFALMSSKNGLSLRAIGKVESNLIEDNYTDESVKGYKHITDCLESNDPCGRLILLQGPPGTGKSYMIRSLVSSVNSTFIVVGAHMIADLSGPAILPVIMGCIDTDDPKPITFILEDSDIALSDRKKGGVAELSGLLNLGDGLLGEMLDIRILATTNVSTLDLDPAVTRPGRMCQHIRLDPLSAEGATKRLSQLVKDEKRIIKKDTTLAEVYRMARKDGWEPKVEAKKSEGQYI